MARTSRQVSLPANSTKSANSAGIPSVTLVAGQPLDTTTGPHKTRQSQTLIEQVHLSYLVEMIKFEKILMTERYHRIDTKLRWGSPVNEIMCPGALLLRMIAIRTPHN